MADWIVAVFTALSVIGAGFSWWKANASRKSRDESKAAAVRAKDTLAEVRRQTVALEDVAAAVRPAPLVFEHDSGVIWRLRNTTGQEIAIERLENLDSFLRAPLDLLPLVIQPNDAAEVTLMGAYGKPIPPTMELRIRGRDDILRVPIPPD